MAGTFEKSIHSPYIRGYISTLKKHENVTMPVQTFPITLQESTHISPLVKHFTFTTEHDFNFTAGQFITIHFERDGKMLRRSYSLANKPSNDNRIEFAAGFVENGPGTQLLFNLKPGETININGPFGRLILKEEPVKRYILMATSTGVTPYLSMLDEIAGKFTQNPDLKVVVIQGVQKKEDLLYGKEFQAFDNQHPRFQFRAHYSREQGNDLSHFEYKGYVQTAFDSLHLDPENDIVYLCGNPGMIDDSFEQLKSLGFTIANIRREKYISR